MAALTPDEIEVLRYHLGYGNLQVGAYPWTPDGFFELFTNVVKPYLSDGLSTSAATAIDTSAGPVIATLTPGAMSASINYGQGPITSAIVPGARLIIDCDDDAEIVVVKSTTLTTCTAKFKRTHDASGYPVAVETGTSKLRYLLHRAGRVHEAMFGPLVTATAGLASVDKGEVVWIGQSSVLKGQLDQYRAIVAEISSLVRVDPVAVGGERMGRMEAY
jgi:hypothetical protein